MLEFYLFKLGEFLSCSLPLHLAYKVGIFLSTIQFYISKKDRDAVINNLKVILPQESEAAIREKAKQVFINFGLYLVEFCRISSFNLEFVSKHFVIKGRENIDNALKAGKGAILVTCHMGNWEVAGMALSLAGYPLMVIALDHKDERLNNFFRERRENKGIEVVSLGIAIKRCYKGLKENKLVAILGDRDFSNSSYALDFLGRKKNIPRGPAVLSLRTGAPIIPVIVTRQGLDQSQIDCLPPLEANENTSELELVKKYAKVIEEHIYKYPSQWIMFREFWKE